MKYYLCPFWEKRGAGKRYSFLLEKTQWKTWCAKTKQGKIQQKAFSCWEWLGCQGVYLAVMDGSCSFPSFTTCEVVWSLKGLHLRARMEWCLLPVPGGGCGGSDRSRGRWENWNIPSEQANPSHARAEVWLCRAGVRSTGVATGQWHQICGPQRSSGQNHSLASGTVEQGWHYLGLCVEYIAYQEAAKHSWAERRLGERVIPCNGTVGKGKRRDFHYVSFPAGWNFHCSKSDLFSVCSQM